MTAINYIVSGLPRSGTSLIMQMLKNGGMRIATDGKRKADENNPKGYLEINDMVKKLKTDSKSITNYTGRVVKIIAYGLQYLPQQNRRFKRDYKIIYVERNIEEVLDSMEKMAQIIDKERFQTKESFLLLNTYIKNMMEERVDTDIMIIDYSDLIDFPKDSARRIKEFFEIPELDEDAMAKTVDKKLYRNRR